MKKILLGLMVVTLTVALSLSVMAGTPVQTGQPLPDGSVEHEAWKLVNDSWSSMGEGNREANARAWSSKVVIGSCNKTYWEIPVTVHASVAQWIEFSLSGSRYDWRVRKPGIYAANSLTAALKSNSDVEIEFEGFGNLDGGGVRGYIDTWYAYGATLPGSEDPRWIPASALDGMSPTVPDSAGLHTGYSWKLWNKIKVTECNSACEYQDDAKITLVLMNQKCWIDPATGYFAGY